MYADTTYFTENDLRNYLKLRPSHEKSYILTTSTKACDLAAGSSKHHIAVEAASWSGGK
jgi:hypothetical protein